jgi:hypothetical protein
MIVVTSLLAAAGVASAQEKITTSADQSVVVARKSSAITNEKANKGSVSKVVQGTTNILLYVPPEGVKDGEDEVQYTADNLTAKVAISIRPSAPQLNDAQFYSASFKALFALFILAVVVESGLALIFNMKPYLNLVDTKAVNPIIAFVFSLALVWLFDLDIGTTLMNIYSGAKAPPNYPSMVLTAMIIAGGSAGVNRLFQAFGFRSPAAQQAPVVRPPPTQAWLSVALKRNRAVGPVWVNINSANQPRVAGSIAGQSFFSHPAVAWAVRNKSRFPQSGGEVITPGTEITVTLEGKASDGAVITSPEWGPFALAPGAIVDIELTL